MFEIVFTGLLLILITWILFSQSRSSKKFSHSVNMATFLIENPDKFIEHSNLSEILRHIRKQKWNRFLFGEPYLALKKIVSPVGTKYYLAVPQNSEEALASMQGLSKIDHPVIPAEKSYSAANLKYLPSKINYDSPKMNENEGVALQALVRYGSKSDFETDIKMLTWADSKERAEKILWLKPKKTAIFDFFHKIFESKNRVSVSMEELKDVFLK